MSVGRRIGAGIGNGLADFGAMMLARKQAMPLSGGGEGAADPAMVAGLDQIGREMQTQPDDSANSQGLLRMLEQLLGRRR